MKINVDQEILDLDEKPIIKSIDKDGKQINLKLQDVICGALIHFEQNDQDGSEKVLRFEIALKVKAFSEVDLKSEEIAKIKSLIGKIYAPVVVGRAHKMLEKE
jgi:hypothetical protein